MAVGFECIERRMASTTLPPKQRKRKKKKSYLVEPNADIHQENCVKQKVVDQSLSRLKAYFLYYFGWYERLLFRQDARHFTYRKHLNKHFLINTRSMACCRCERQVFPQGCHPKQPKRILPRIPVVTPIRRNPRYVPNTKLV